MKKALLSIFFVILMIAIIVPVAFAAGDGVPTTIDVGEMTGTYMWLGEGGTCYDEDGYIITGTNENFGVQIDESCNVTLKDLKMNYLSIVEDDITVNIMLKGDNETKLSLFESDIIFDAAEGASLKTDMMYTSGNDGTVTINGGNIMIEQTEQKNYPSISCTGGFTINGGTVTASNVYHNVITTKVNLNGGVLNVISTAPQNGAINADITMKKGAALNVETTGVKAVIYSGINLADDDKNGGSLFIRFDKTSDFVPMYNVNEVIENKTYLEIKAAEHEHVFESSRCSCGYECAHENYADKKCQDCGAEGKLIIFNLLDDYEDGWNGNAIIVKKLVNGAYTEITNVTFYEGKSYQKAVIIGDNDIYVLEWKIGNYPDECSFTVTDNDKVICEVADAYELKEGEIVYSSCEHEFVKRVCSKCKLECGVNFSHKITDDVCSVCNTYVYAITHQPTQSKPNVKLNDSEGAKYQWYEVEYTATEITDINASGTWEIYDYDKDVNYGVYDKKNGWAGHDNKFFVVKLKKGQIVKGEFSQALNHINLWIATSDGVYYSEQQLMLKDNKFSFTAEIDGYYGVKGTDFMPVSMLSLYKEAASLRAFVCDTQYSAVNGETDAELKAYKPGKSYYCEVKCGDGFSTVRSDEVDFDYEITHQPTEAEPYVSVNSNNVASYQWYKDGETSAAINGETAAQLKNLVYGETYFCEVTFTDGFKVYSDILDYTYKIIHQPTEAEPYVALNSDKDATYQWNVLEESQAEIDDKVAAPRDSSSGEVASYEAGKGWKGALDYVSDTFYEFNFFKINLEKGQVIVLEPDAATTNFGIWSNNYYEDFDVEEGKTTYTYTAAESAEFNVWCDTPQNSAYMKAYTDGYEHVKLEGETAATLKNPVYGKLYTCEVTFGNGEKKYTNIVDFTYKITHQPTEEEPYVSVNNGEGATYQWYEESEPRMALTDKTARPVIGADIGKELTDRQASYDEKEGWLGAYHMVNPVSFYYYFVTDLKAGDTVELEFSKEMTGYFFKDLETGDSYPVTHDGKNGTFTAEKDMSAVLYYIGEAWNVRVKAWLKVEPYTALEGETSAQLKNIVHGKKYICKVSFADGTEKNSEILDYSYKITHQPTAAEPYAAINYSDGATYQWYKLVPVEKNITDLNALTKNPEWEDTSLSWVEGFYDGEWWSGRGYTDWYDSNDNNIVENFYFVGSFKKGDKIKFELETTRNLRELYVGKVNGSSDTIVDFDENNIGEYLVVSDGDYVIYSTEYYSDETAPSRLKATLYTVGGEKIDAETESTLKTPETGESYYCVVTAKDESTYTTDSFLYKYVIKSQPSKNNLSVATNDNAVKAYQWYKVTGDKTEVDGAIASSFDYNEIMGGGQLAPVQPASEDGTTYSIRMPLLIPSTYTDKGWIPCYAETDGNCVMFHFVIDLKKGQKMELEFSEDVLFGAVIDNILSSDYVMLEVENKKATFTAEKDGTYIIGAMGDKVANLRAYIDERVFTPVNGATAKTYTTYENGKYACEVTFSDDTKEMSETAELVHTCDFAGTWKTDGTKHWKLCVCGATGNSASHNYSDACDTTCNTCSAKRTITHDYKAATCTAPKTCKVCKATTGKALGHKYTNACDTSCNTCKATRKITHSYKSVTTKATLKKNGKVETKCTVCGKVSKKTTVYYPKTIKLEYTSTTYNGKAKSPKVTVKDSKGNTLKKDTDYTVKYASGRKSTGKYAVTITFKGKYSGTKTLYFNILPSKTSKITPTCSTTEIKASWKSVTGASGYKVELLNSKGKVVKKVTTTKTSYTFKKLSKVTTYKVRVTAYKIIDKKAVYSSVSTTIKTSTAPAKVTLSKVTSGSKSATPAWKTVSGASGYQVQCSTSSKFKSAKTATVKKASSKKTTIKKLTKGKKYYFKVRAYKTVDGKKIYGAWSAVKSVKIK